MPGRREPDERRHRGEREQDDAERVGLAAPRVVSVVAEHRAQAPERDRAERQVDEKEPPPARVVDDEPADHRPADAREREDDREVRLVARAQARRDDFADERLRERHQAAAAEALHDARRDQQRQRRRKPAGERADREDEDRGRQHLPAAMTVAEPAVERHHDHRREQVADREPRGVAQVAELAADHRRRGREQRLVDRGEEHRQHHREEQAPEARAVEGRRRIACRFDGRRRGAARTKRGIHWRMRQVRPVEPKPPSPRALASNEATTRNSAWTTGTITIWAMRSKGSIVNGAWPRFQQLTISGPW